MRCITFILLLVAFTEVFARPALSGDPDSGSRSEATGSIANDSNEDEIASQTANDEPSDEADDSLEDVQNEEESAEDRVDGSEESSQEPSTDEQNREENEQEETTEDSDQEKKQLEEPEQKDTEEDAATNGAQLSAVKATETTTESGTQEQPEESQSTTETTADQLNSSESTVSWSSTEENEGQIGSTEAAQDEGTAMTTLSKHQQESKNENVTQMKGELGYNHSQKVEELASMSQPEASTSTYLPVGTTTTSAIEKVNAQEDENDVSTVPPGDDEPTSPRNTSTDSPNVLLGANGVQKGTSSERTDSNQEAVNGSSTEPLRATLTAQNETVNISLVKRPVLASSSNELHAAQTTETESSTSSATTAPEDKGTEDMKGTLQMTELDEQTVGASLSRNNEPTDEEIPVMNDFAFDLPMFNESLHGELLLNDTDWAKDLAAAAHPYEENVIHDPCTFISENIHSAFGLNVSKEQVQNTLPTFRFLLESSTEDLTTIKDMLMACVKATVNNQESVDPGCIQIRSLIGKTCQQSELCRGKEEEVMYRVMHRIREVIDTDQLADALLMIRACAGQSYE